jgi:hypothetical protein
MKNVKTFYTERYLVVNKQMPQLYTNRYPRFIPTGTLRFITTGTQALYKQVPQFYTNGNVSFIPTDTPTVLPR